MIKRYFDQHIFRKRSIWGISGSAIWPLIYFRKPKWMTEDDFQYVMSRLRLVNFDPYCDLCPTPPMINEETKLDHLDKRD